MRHARIQPGKRILINGARGSIGIFSFQIAQSMEAQVTAVDAPHKEKLLRDLGLDRFIDHTKQPFWEDGERYDVILNMVARSPYSQKIQTLSSKGRCFTANPRVSVMARSFVTSVFTSRSAGFAFAGETTEELTTLKEMIEDGKLDLSSIESIL